MQTRNNAILIGYATITISALSGVLLIPFYLKHLGINDFGFYQYVYAIAQYAIVLDFGISTVMVRYLTEFKAKDDRRGEENYAMQCLLMVLACVVLICAAGVVLGLHITTIIGDRPQREIDIAVQLFWLILAQLIIAIFQHYFDGVIMAHEKYTVAKGVAFFKYILRLTLIPLYILCDFGVEGIVLGEITALLLCLSFSMVYCFAKLKFRAVWHYWDRVLFRQTFVLVFALILQSVILYANTAVAKLIVGRLIGNEAVAIFAISLTFINIFCEIPGIINSVYLPQITRNVIENSSGDQLTDAVIRPGRIQFILCGGMLGGFLLFGRQFVLMWAGEGAQDAWLLAVLPMIAIMLPVVQNVCLSILVAKDKRIFRSYMLLAGAVLNALVSYVMVSRIGIMGVAVGYALTVFIFDFLVMNVYYQRVIGLNVIRIFAGIFKDLGSCLLIAAGLCGLLLLQLPAQGVLWFASQCLTFCLIFGTLLYGYGLNAAEKNQMRKMISGVLPT